MIAAALAIGISKRELMDDYYFDEFKEVMKQYNAVSTPKDPEAEEVYIDRF